MAIVALARPAAHRRFVAVLGAGVLSTVLAATGGPLAATEGPGSVVATTEVLGSVVSQLVGDAGEVTVVMPAGANPHSYEPSARDAERLLSADVVVSNGLELEESLQPLLEAAESDGVTWFQATDHVALLDLDEPANDGSDHQAAGEAEPDEHDHADGDPHFWTDPLAMRDVVRALEPVLADVGIDVSANADTLVAELEALDTEVMTILEVVPAERRKLVTGHRSLGYFADRYGFEQIGTVIPSLSTSGEPTAREMAQLIADIRSHDVGVVFTEVGTPTSVAQAVASDSGAELVPLSTSRLPEGGSYRDLVHDIATTVAGALAP